MPDFPPTTSLEWRQSLQAARHRRAGAKDRITKVRIKYMTNITLENAINLACNLLPDGWQIFIKCERGAAWVEAITPDMDTKPIEIDEAGLTEKVYAAFELAKSSK